MLKSLLPLLRKGDLIGLSIGCEGGGDASSPIYRINVTPKLFTLDGEKGGDRLALNKPITITGTAEELDSPAFAETLTRFTTSVTSTRHTLEEVEAEHKKAAEAAKSRPSPKVAATPSAPKTSPKKPGAKSSSWKDRVKPKVAATPSSPDPVDAPKPGVEGATPSII